MEPMDRSSYTVEAMIRGYHVYRDAYQEIWAKNDYSIRVRISESNAKSLNLTPKPIQAYSCPVAVTCGTQKSAGMMLECVCSIKKARALVFEHLLSSSGYIDKHSGLSPVRAYCQDVQPFGRISSAVSIGS